MSLSLSVLLVLHGFQAVGAAIISLLVAWIDVYNGQAMLCSRLQCHGPDVLLLRNLANFCKHSGCFFEAPSFPPLSPSLETLENMHMNMKMDE